jgi:hypothetical protein
MLTRAISALLTLMPFFVDAGIEYALDLEADRGRSRAMLGS